MNARLKASLSFAPPTDPDIALLVLWNQHFEVSKAWGDACYKAEITHYNNRPSVPEIILDRSPNAEEAWHMGDPGIATQFERDVWQLGHQKAVELRRQRIEADRQWRAAWEAKDAMAGVPAMEAEAARLCRIVDEIEQQILDTPAEGVLGVAVKLMLWRHLNGSIHYAPREKQHVALVAALQDAERLGGVPLSRQFYYSDNRKEVAGTETRTVHRDEEERNAA